MVFSVRTFTSSNQDKLAALVNDKGAPLFWPNTFVTSQYLSTGKAHTTICKVLRTLAMLYLWAKAQPEPINIDQLLTDGEFLNINQIEDLALFLRLNAAAQWGIYKKSQKKNNRKVVRLEQIRSAVQENGFEKQAASNYEAAVRIHWIAKYFEYHLSQRLGKLTHSSTDIAHLKIVAETAISRLKSITPRASPAKNDEALQGLPPQAILVAEQAFEHDSQQNPFLSKFIRHRNYLIWRLLLDTGARRDEIRNLKVDDIDYSQHTTLIRVSKTRPRTVPHSMRFSFEFHTFIVEFWSKLPKKCREHGHLFTTQRGHHLSNEAINKIFRTMRTHILELPCSLTPHALRRTWNDRFSEKSDRSTTIASSSQEQQIRNRLMGWADNSQMAVRYAKRHIRKNADIIANELANELHGGKPSDDND